MPEYFIIKSLANIEEKCFIGNQIQHFHRIFMKIILYYPMKDINKVIPGPAGLPSLLLRVLVTLTP